VRDDDDDDDGGGEESGERRKMLLVVLQLESERERERGKTNPIWLSGTRARTQSFCEGAASFSREMGRRDSCVKKGDLFLSHRGHSGGSGGKKVDDKRGDSWRPTPCHPLLIGCSSEFLVRRESGE